MVRTLALAAIPAAVALRAPLPAATRPRRSGALRMVDPPLVDAATAFDASAFHSTLELAAIQGRTCVEDASWWCTVQNGVQGAIEGLHDGIHDGLGVKQNSWGISIILFTAFLRTVIYPLNFISYESTERNKALKPYMDKIKDRYGEDQQAVNLATAKLYEMTETNPLAGCLPAIAQTVSYTHLTLPTKRIV